MQLSRQYVQEWLDGEHRCVHDKTDKECLSCLVHSIWYAGYAKGRFNQGEDIRTNEAMGWYKAGMPGEWICDGCGCCGDCDKCGTNIMWIKSGTDLVYCSDCFIIRRVSGEI